MNDIASSLGAIRDEYQGRLNELLAEAGRLKDTLKWLDTLIATEVSRGGKCATSGDLFPPQALRPARGSATKGSNLQAAIRSFVDEAQDPFTIRDVSKALAHLFPSVTPHVIARRAASVFYSLAKRGEIVVVQRGEHRNVPFTYRTQRKSGEEGG